MKDHQNRGVVRLGDATSHGGKVISATDDFTVLGKKVALDGDKVSCPQCKGVFAIVVQSSDRKHKGKRVAYDGDRAACGAELISSIR